MSLKFKYANGNPWQRNLPDCVIRSLALGLNMSYREICKRLNVRYELGKGMVRHYGACTTKKMIQTFREYFSNIEWDHFFNDKDPDFIEKRYGDSLMDQNLGLTVDEQAEILPKGMYIFVLRPTKEEKAAGAPWHHTLVNTATMTLLDTFDCREGSIVYGWLAINMSKRLTVDDPVSRYKEVSLIDKGYLWGNHPPPYVSKETWAKWQEEIKHKKPEEVNYSLLSWILKNMIKRGLKTEKD